MYGIVTGPFLPKGDDPKSVGFLSDNYGGYLTPQQTQRFKKLGRGVVAIELLGYADENNIPNQLTFFKDLIGMKYSTKPEAYKAQWDKVFNTLGNGKLEVNDVLAFPLNLYSNRWGKRAYSKNKNISSNPNNNRSNNNNNNRGGGNSNVIG